MEKILITGGAGYIGSHVAKLLNHNKKEIIVFDNLSIGKKKYVKHGIFFKGDLRNKSHLYKIFSKYKIKSVIHLAANCLVGESQNKVDEYYENNVVGTINLLDVMIKFKVKNIIFSSTCSVYGYKNKKINEDEKLKPINVYGETKKVCEELIQTYSKAYKFNFIILRYFNACGADVDGELGEDRENETHLIPLIFKSIKKKKPVRIFGNDYKTKDKTCIRDYVHVQDIARAHVKCLSFLNKNKKSFVFNLGTEKGLSVLDIVKITSKVLKIKVDYKFSKRRKGDPPYLVARSNRIRKKLNFKNKFSDPELIIKTAWQWFKSIK
jgi:UDP-glucose 4-epimerase